MNTLTDFDEVVKVANSSKDPVLWIKAKTQSGKPCSFVIDLKEDKKGNARRRETLFAHEITEYARQKI